VGADLDLVGPDRRHGREDRDFEGDPGDLVGPDGGEPVVPFGGGRGHVADRLPEGHGGFDVADAAAEVVADPQGNKNGPLLAKGAVRVPQSREVAAAGGGRDRLSRQIQERRSVLGGEHAPSLRDRGYFFTGFGSVLKLVGATLVPFTTKISTQRATPLFAVGVV